MAVARWKGKHQNGCTPFYFFTMKKLFLLLTLFLCTSMAWAYDAEVSGIYYYLNQSKKTAQVISNYGNKYTGDICIPESISVEGTIYVVTSLGNSCFCRCTGLTSVTIPNSVTSLGDWCFYKCTGLTSINIPKSVTSLGYRCFYGCNNLSTISRKHRKRRSWGNSVGHLWLLRPWRPPRRQAARREHRALLRRHFPQNNGEVRRPPPYLSLL